MRRRLKYGRWTPCAWCAVERAVTPDHEPPLTKYPPGEWRGELVPSCKACNIARGGWGRQEKAARRRAKRVRNRRPLKVV